MTEPITAARRPESCSRGNMLVALSTLFFALAIAILAIELFDSERNAIALLVIVPFAIPALMGFAIHTARLLLHYTLGPLANVNDLQPIIEPVVVVVPVIIRDAGDIENIGACAEANLPFLARFPLVFLVDLPDTNSEKNTTDAALLAHLNIRIAAQVATARVIILTRHRRYDAIDCIWRGWERKRGKLEEFCLLLRGDTHTSFDQALPDALRGTHAFVTIDIDTRLQPRTIVCLMRSADRNAAIVAPMLKDLCRLNPSHFEWLQQAGAYRFSANPRLNFNQSRLGYDLFFGKGLIIVDRFLTRMRGRIAERTILSHDHLEAMLVGAVASTTAVVQEYVPMSRAQWVRRQYRWTRGDFQLVPWIIRSDLSVTSRLHLLEVVLNHLIPPCCFLWSMVALIAMPFPTGRWIAISGLFLAQPTLVLLPLLLPLMLSEKGSALPSRWQRARLAFLSESAAWALNFAYAPGNALLVARAALVVTYRRGWSGRNLLEWEDGREVRQRTSWSNHAAFGLGAISLVCAMITRDRIQLVAGLISAWIILPLILRARFLKRT